MSDKKETKNVSGTFQIVEDDRKQELKSSKENELDEESLYYARIFMED
ncbi:hypothetical protein SM124_19610 [Bacillus sp. 31A1R]|uniref:Uncharacterized protein n=1 Tax=Robertmurraya mangrovi TaxID=3098077 RepID=A0ABU5J3C6_9BACI|nr:hypothetical protein [Bacillus sp. 31A1R]MDZ5473931.1 hypothetical protein [Bacillus sp. 31A1R]